MTKQFEISISNRTNVLESINNLSVDQINKIPEGFNNSICWNVGHILVSQQLLTYKLAGFDCLVPTFLIEKYKKGSTCTENTSIDEIEKIKNNLLSVVNRTYEDYKNSIFKNYSEYVTSSGIILNNIEEGIQFSNIHDAIHIGIIMSLKKILQS